jgi:2-amino-4-hydroxy-6-hydroxymethyldihydropteridine diphosphokinase
LNGAAELITALSPRELLDRLLEIEREMGRERREKWGPRVIDLDLLLYEDRVIEEQGLIVPHPRMHERAFVLVPLAEIAPDIIHPVLKRIIGDLRDALVKAKK